MKYKLPFKIIAFFLCAALLMGAVFGTVALVLMTVLQSEFGPPEESYQASQEIFDLRCAEGLAHLAAYRYNLENVSNLSEMEQHMGGDTIDRTQLYLQEYVWSEVFDYVGIGEEILCRIADSEGRLLYTNIPRKAQGRQVQVPISDSPNLRFLRLTWVSQNDLSTTEKLLYAAPDRQNYTRCIDYYPVSQADDTILYHVTLTHVRGANYLVTVVLPDSLSWEDHWPWRLAMVNLYTALYPHQEAIAGMTLAALVGFFICLVYLCCAASAQGKSGKPGAAAHIPLDAGLLVLSVELGLGLSLLEELGYRSSSFYTMLWDSWLWVLVIPIGLLAAVLPLLYLYALIEQGKLGGGWWWRRSLIGRLLLPLFRLVRRGLRGLGELIRMLPMVWQWLLAGAGLLLASLLLVLLALSFPPFLFLLALLWVGAICYGGWCFGKLYTGAKNMAEGELQAAVDERYMVGAYRDFARQLNALQSATAVAVEKGLRSERMKAELITNVSHDIKTPLTSIINYADLLSKDPTPEEQQQYLEVLSRQSLRMKKLLEDLTELSKASSGNITVNLETLDVGEAVTQALGEYADKLASAGLTPVVKLPETPVAIRADGRLLWRVLGNLLGNAVKYALPGTRLYVDVEKSGQDVAISLKNISREPLNLPPEELLERFVRGDSSRQTEGSGLGLNIAHSLMTAQQGSLELQVDGDLFKVVLHFPAA